MFIPTPGLEQLLIKWWSRWVLRGRQPRPEILLDGGQSLRYTARYRWTASVGFALCTCAYVVASQDERLVAGDILKTAVLIGVAVLIWLLFSFFFVSSQIERVVITPTQIGRRSWRGRQEIVWGEVTAVRVDYAHAAVKIQGPRGTVIDVSFYLDGLPALGDALKQHRSLPRGFLATVLSDRSVLFG